LEKSRLSADVYCNIVLHAVWSVGTGAVWVAGPLGFTILNSGRKSSKSATCDSWYKLHCCGCASG